MPSVRCYSDDFPDVVVVPARGHYGLLARASSASASIPDRALA